MAESEAAGHWNVIASKRQQEKVTRLQGSLQAELARLQTDLQKELAHYHTELETKMQSSLDSFRDTLERHRSYDVFHRDRISSHIDKVIEAFNELYGLGELLALKTWLDSPKSLEVEQQFRSAWRRLDTHRAALGAFGVVSDELDRDWRDTSGSVWLQWGVAMGEVYRKNPTNVPPGGLGGHLKTGHRLTGQNRP